MSLGFSSLPAALLHAWVGAVIVIALAYAVRNWALTLNRLTGNQRSFYQDIVDGDVPRVTVLIPMHNEETVADKILTTLLETDYPQDRLEIIPIDDHSSDKTEEILKRYAALYPLIKPLHRRSGMRGKPAGLNDALELATSEIVLVFDADYQPCRGLLRTLAAAFHDPEVGAVMGRVVPQNTPAGLLARMLDLERTAGYQVDQQARYNLDLIPQYGGTVGGFRRSLVRSLGGFDPRMLAEDTHLTFQMYLLGWRVAYANRAECYEEVPETWEVRFKQLRRWARGHNQILFRYWRAVLSSPYLTALQKIDGLLVLIMYALPVILFSGLIANLLLFLMGETSAGPGILLILFAFQYNSFGNFAPFFQVGAAGLLDGMMERLKLLPFLFFLFLFNTWVVTCGFVDAVLDVTSNRMPVWDKTVRFQKQE